jgi:predicted dehydrogenase
MKKNKSRRTFIRQLGAGSLALTGSLWNTAYADEYYEQHILPQYRFHTANDTIRIGVIGTGIQGNSDLKAALKVPGAELAGACDLYTGRLTRMQEVYGQDLYTTRDYRELLNRKDIDAVIIATSDHWHSKISMDAMKAGKHVYCEKPMVHKIEQGLEVIKTQKATGKVMQVGSQPISGVDFAKAREIYQSGTLGKLNCIETSNDRQSAIGAWQYSIPTDQSTQTVDWDKYVSNMNQKPAYDPNKFFRWRNYRDFGTGMAGDLYVHLITGIHYVTGVMGPSRILSSGQLCYWKDGRDVPDVLTTLLDYAETPEHPAFQVMLRVNFVSGAGGSGGTKFIGSEGVMTKTGGGVKVNHSIMPKAPGMGGYDSLFTFPQAMQDKMMAEYNAKWSEEDKAKTTRPAIEFTVPEGHDAHVNHFANFFETIRSNKPNIEDPTFAFRAAGPCLAANESYFKKKIIKWDPVQMKLIP